MNEETELQDLDAPPTNRLEDIFTLPEEYAQDERIVRWYDEIVTRMRREAAGVPMNTTQQLLLERIAFFYVRMRHKEMLDGGFTLRDQKEMTASLQTSLDSFNRLLEKNSDKVHKENLGRILGIMNEILPMISDKSEQTRIRTHLIAAFKEMEEG
jgi:hypothetical protein